jgi:hypothetical protein
MNWLELAAYLSVILAGFSILIALFIALRQQKQLENLRAISEKTIDIGEQTNKITEKMRTDSLTQANVKRFFRMNESQTKNDPFHIYFPVEFNKKPLPLINQGDFYAIHIIGSLCGDENIQLHPISKQDQIGLNKQNIDQNLVLICAPHANPVLNCIFPLRSITSDVDLKKIIDDNWPLNKDDLDLPCWFVEDSRDIDERAARSGEKISDSEQEISYWKSRKIWVSETQDLISSPTEVLYQEAYHSSTDTTYKHPENSQQDFGIIARITINNRQVILIAGVHQYGTWIIGGLLNNILTGVWDRIEDRTIFFGDKDFIVIIWGEFNYKKLKVERTKILTDYAWTRENNTWIRIK